MVVIFDLDTVIRVNSATIRYIQVIVPESVIVGNYINPGSGSPFNLPPQALSRVGRRIGLPSVDDPRLDLQVWIRKNLDSHAREEPRGIRRNIGRLVCPVIVVVITEQSDVRHEDSRVYVDPVQHVNVIT